MNTKVIISADDQTRAGIESVKSSLAGLGMEAQALSGVLKGAFAGLASALSANAFASWIKGSIDAADSMNDLSQRLGIAVRDLGAWSLAAAQSGTSMATIAQGVKTLSGYMVRHSDELRKAGITATDANGAMIQLADLFAAMPDGIEKTALATKLFGRSGGELIPLLNGGSVELEKVKNKAAEYAAQLEELAPLANKFNDLLEELALQSKTTGMAFSSMLIGPMAEIVELFKDARTGADGFHNAMLRLQKLTKSGPLSIFDTAAALSEKGGAGQRALALAGMGGNAAKREAKGLIVGGEGEMARFEEATEKYLKENKARLRAMALLNEATTETGQGNGRAAPKTDLQKMNELGERNLAAAKAAEYVAVDDDEEARLGSHKRQMESLRLQKQETDAIHKRAEAIKDALEPERVLARQIEEINALREHGELTGNQAAIAEANLTQKYLEQHGALKDLEKSGKDAFKGITDTIESMGNKAADTFADMLVGGKSTLSDLITSWLKDLARLQAKQTFDPLTKAASSWVGNLFSDGFYPYGGANLDVGNMSANGNAFDGRGVIPFARGGIIDRPMLFPFAKGIGLMGEAGPEAILPLSRGPGGKLGVSAGGFGGDAAPQSIRVELINSGTPQKVASATPRFDAEGMVLTVVMREMEPGGLVARRMERQYGLNAAAGAV